MVYGFPELCSNTATDFLSRRISRSTAGWGAELCRILSGHVGCGISPAKLAKKSWQKWRFNQQWQEIDQQSRWEIKWIKFWACGQPMALTKPRRPDGVITISSNRWIQIQDMRAWEFMGSLLTIWLPIFRFAALNRRGTWRSSAISGESVNGSSA